MSARDDHRVRVIAGLSEQECWAALFDEIDRLRRYIEAARVITVDGTETIATIVERVKATDPPPPSSPAGRP